MGLSLEINIPKNPIMGKTEKTQDTVLIRVRISIPAKMRIPPIFFTASWKKNDSK